MDENPYRAPNEHASEDPDVGGKPRSWLSLLICVGLSVIFLSIAVLIFVAFRFRPRAQGAATIIWALLNAGMWCVTAWAMWTKREQLEKIILFGDLAALLSIVVI